MKKGASTWVYVGPLILAFLEYILRRVLHSRVDEFMGPTILAAAISMLFPLTALKTLTSLGGNFGLVDVQELKFVFLLSYVIVGMVLAWIIDLCMALQPGSLGFGNDLLQIMGIWPIIVAAPMYWCAVVLSVYKERRW